MRMTGRSEDNIALVETYAKAQGLWRHADMTDPVFTDTLTLDMGTVVPSLAGPKRPQDKVILTEVDDVFNARSEEHTSELQSLMRISYAVFCLKKKTKKISSDI